MTTIAFDGKTIAADCQSTYGSFPVKVRKLNSLTYKGQNAVAACAGTIREFQPIIEWLKAGGKKKSRPDVDDEKPDFSIIIATESGNVFYANDSLFFHDMGKVRWAIGSGADYALGAMEAGKTAPEAIAIASRLDVNTGLGVDSVEVVT